MRVSQKLIKDIDKSVRQFNAKIRRLEKSGRQDIIIPERVSRKEFKDYETTKDIRRRINQLKRFSRRGAEKAIKLSEGEYVSIWEKKEHDILKRSALSKISKQIKYYETHVPTVYGKKESVSFAKTGDEAYLRLVSERNRLKTKGLLKREQMFLENKRASRILTDKRKQFRENYYKMLEDIAFMLGEKEKGELIKEQLDKLSDKEFIKFFDEDKGVSAITFFYQTIEDNMFYNNYQYVKNNFEALSEHLVENYGIEQYREMTKRGTGWRKTFNDYAQDQVTGAKANGYGHVKDINIDI